MPCTSHSTRAKKPLHQRFFQGRWLHAGNTTKLTCSPMQAKEEELQAQAALTLLAQVPLEHTPPFPSGQALVNARLLPRSRQLYIGH